MRLQKLTGHSSIAKVQLSDTSPGPLDSQLKFFAEEEKLINVTGDDNKEEHICGVLCLHPADNIYIQNNYITSAIFPSEPLA